MKKWFTLLFALVILAACGSSESDDFIEPLPEHLAVHAQTDSPALPAV